MPLPPTVADLIERFSRNLETYKSSDYNETRLRIEFLDPLFQSLGWDIANTAGNADAYKDVIHEDSLKIGGLGGGTKAPDYCFRIGSTRKFFLEAKKPAIDIKGDPSPAYQLRRYAWSAKLPLSVLSDFEEFAIYDTRVKPDVNDKSSAARIFYCTYTEFPQHWDYIVSILSRDAVWKGSFDKFAESSKSKRGTAEVDDAFLEEIERWRDELAANIATRNSNISERDLNVAVTKTIDRIVFLRICEDRGVEIYAQLQTIAKTNDIYGELLKLFRRADEKYNSGLFHFSKEKDRPEEPDILTPTLDIDDKILRPILTSLYYPECPYEFSVLPSDILGHVYEQFLGKVIRLTAGHRAKVEEKPEVRKAGGVYYTPTYIVNYIVQNTLGKLLEAPDGNPGLSPRDAAKLKILDPACGSGSFLLGAYQYLMDWHLRYYAAHNPDEFLKQKNPPIYQVAARSSHIAPASAGFPPSGKSDIAYRLTTAERKRILLNNIHGVDIDQNAVETTKLSLLLKVLEGESGESLNNQMKLFRQRALPDLANNIKCGNSLIAGDFYQNEQLSLLGDEETRYKINAFDWDKEFEAITKSGGFNAVIGNPPYVVIGKEDFRPDVSQYLSRYDVAEYKSDLFHLFIDRGLQLLSNQGLLGFIVPNTWLTLKFTRKLRDVVVTRSTILKLDVLDHRVFKDADVHTALLVLEKSPPSPKHLIDVRKFGESFEPSDLYKVEPTKIRQSVWATDEDRRFDTNTPNSNGFLVKKIIAASTPLSQSARVSLGCQAYNSTKHTKQQIEKRVFHADRKLGTEYLPELAGKDVARYHIERTRGQWIKYGPWLHDYRTMDWLKGPRLLIREITSSPPRCISACYVEATYCNYKTILNVNPLSSSEKLSMKFLAGILNSKVVSFVYPFVSNKIVAKTFPRLSVGDLRNLPVPKLDFANPSEKAKHDRLVQLVDAMLSLHQQLAKAKSGREQIQRQIDSADKQIDSLVYDLYQLTPEEIQLVENGTAKLAAE